MMAALKTIDLSKVITGIFPIGADYSAFNFISMQIQFTGVDATNCLVAFVKKHNIDDAQWNRVPLLDEYLTVTADSVTFINADFDSTYIGLYINKGSAHTGILQVSVNAKNQI